MRIALFRTVCLSLLTLVFVAGCGGNNGPQLYSVSGNVKYKDKPVPGANVMFSPEKGAPALGKTNSSGDFSLSTNGVSGAIAGPGVWTITAFEPFEAPKAITAEEAGKLVSEGKPLPMVTAKSIIPEKYGVNVTTTLKMEVSTDSSKNKFEIVLTD